MRVVSPEHVEYDSLADLAAHAVHVDYSGSHADETDNEWAGGVNLADAKSLAVTGWYLDLAETLRVVESAVRDVERDLDQHKFRAVYDVAGDEPDVQRFLAGEPENMVDYPLTMAPRAGRVIALCASISYSASIKADAMRRRGEVLAAFALSLAGIGIATEIWADVSLRSPEGAGIATYRVQVQAASDVVDESRICFALAHPAMLRQLIFATWRDLPAADKFGGERIWSRCGVADPPRDLPEGTIYLPSLSSRENVPHAADLLRSLLRQAGLIAT